MPVAELVELGRHDVLELSSGHSLQHLDDFWHDWHESLFRRLSQLDQQQCRLEYGSKFPSL